MVADDALPTSKIFACLVSDVPSVTSFAADTTIDVDLYRVALNSTRTYPRFATIDVAVAVDDSIRYGFILNRLSFTLIAPDRVSVDGIFTNLLRLPE